MLPTKPDLHCPPTYPTECSTVQKLPNAFPVRIRWLPPTQHNRSNGEISVNRRPFLLSCRSNSKFPLPSGRLSATIPGSPSLRHWFPYQTQELIGNATGDNGNGHQQNRPYIENESPSRHRARLPFDVRLRNSKTR